MELKEQIKSFWNKKPCGTFGIIPDDLNIEYFEKIRARRYRLEPFIFDIVKFNETKNKKILEIGCGIGIDGIEFANNGADYTGIDLSAKSIDTCKKNFELYNQVGNIINMDAENLLFENDSFDIIYSWGVLHHTPDMQKAIDEIHRVLKPEGKVIIMMYNRYSLVGLQLYILHGLLKLKPFINWNDLFYNHHESIATKALTDHETKILFNKFKDVKMQNIVTPYDMRITRNKFMPKCFKKLIPHKYGFFRVITAKKF